MSDHTAEKGHLRCRYCGELIREINFALGPEWMHVDPGASFPTTGKGTAWKTCRATTVATPEDPCFCAAVPNIGGGGCGRERCPAGPRVTGSGYCPDACTWPHDHRFERDSVPWPARGVRVPPGEASS